MDKLKLVAKHEFLKLVKSKSYIIMTIVIILLPLLIGIVLGGIAYTSGLSSGNSIGYVDKAGIIGSIEEDNYTRYDSGVSANEALRVGDIMGYYVVPEDYVASGEIFWYSFGGSLLTKTSRLVSEGVIRESLVQGLTQDYLPIVVAERVLEPSIVSEVVLDASGVPAENQEMGGSMVVGIVLGFVFIMVVMMPSGYLLTGLMREKENKVMEILLSSMPSRQLLLGKVFGLGLAGLFQIVVICVGELIIFGLIGTVLSGFGIFNAGTIDTSSIVGGVGIGGIIGGMQLFPQGIGIFIVMVIVYFLLGYLLFTMLLTIVGAVCNVESQASQWQAPLLFICIVPLFAGVIFGNNPNNALLVGMSLFPLTAPLAMIMRLSCVTVPVWQMVASVGIMTLTVGTVFMLIPRLFRGEVLLAGDFKLKRLFGLRGKAR